LTAQGDAGLLRAIVVAALLVLGSLCLTSVGLPGLARADDLTDFEHARTLYDKRNHAGAAAAFKLMVGTDPPRVTERLLVLESRKYLAASLLFLGQQDEARAQFRLLLTQEPGYALDPLAFPTDVVTLFERVKQAVQSESEKARESEQRAREEQQRQQLAAAQAEQANLRKLLSLASESETRQQNSRWKMSGRWRPSSARRAAWRPCGAPRTTCLSAYLWHLPWPASSMLTCASCPPVSQVGRGSYRRIWSAGRTSESSRPRVLRCTSDVAARTQLASPTARSEGPISFARVSARHEGRSGFPVCRDGAERHPDTANLIHSFP
jgi:hypothetical protein